MRRPHDATARLFGPLLASGCEVLISGEGTRRVRLFDGERALVGNATAKRRREFTETRLLAHEALRRIGHDGPILKGSDGEPLWPSGIVGSLSHCPSLCVAAVASAERIRAVGVDVDDSDGLSDRDHAVRVLFRRARIIAYGLLGGT